MQVETEQIRKEDSLQREKMLSAAMKAGKVERSGDTMQYTIRMAPRTQLFTRDLNEGAYTVYQMTADPYMLSVATKWIEKGLEFSTSPEALDTYARLVYVQGQKQKAQELIEKAMKLKTERGMPTTELKTVLDKIQKGVSLK